MRATSLKLLKIMDYKVIITNFTDPVCTWCWGSEPVFRRLETHFPGKIEFRFVMCGLVRDIHEMQDPRNGIGSTDATVFNRQVAAHWQEASERHGMPVDAEHFNLFSDERPSTYPQNIAYKAAQLSNPESADLFLYNLRMASAAEARITSDPQELLQIADESGVDIVTFKRHLNDGSAEQAFHGDLALAASMGVRGFPTFAIKYDDRPMLLRGWRDYETFVDVIDTVTHGEVKPVEVTFTPEALLMLMERHPRMTAEEVRQAFDFNSRSAMEAAIAPLLDDGTLMRQTVGNGYYLAKQQGAMVCDATTGMCM